MSFFEVLLYTALAVLITAVFAIVFKQRGPWGSLWAFFLIIFLAIWAAGLWVRPYGIETFGITWVPVAFFGVLFALVVSAAAPPSNRRTMQKEEKIDPEAKNKPALVAFSAYFWLLMVVLAIAIILGYIL